METIAIPSAGIISRWRNWRERRRALHEFRQLQKDADEQNGFLVKDKLTYALSALDRRDYQQASKLWAESLALSPELTESSPLGLRVLLGLRRFDEAEATMRRGRAKFPRELYYARGLAEIAQARGDRGLAAERWKLVRKHFPGSVHGYVLGAESLIELNRLDEAQALAEAAVRHFPNEIGGFLSSARIAARRKEWNDALERWKTVRDRFDHILGHVGAGHALVELGRYAEAEAILMAAQVRYPTEPEPSIQLAQTSEAQGDMVQAAERWSRLAQHFPLSLRSCLMASERLEQLHRPAEAETVLSTAVERFPRDSVLRVRLGSLLMRLQNFAAAAEIWAALRRDFPETEEAYLKGAEALTKVGRLQEADGVRDEHRRRFLVSTAPDKPPAHSP